MLSQNICAHTCVCAGRRPRCESVQLPGRACVSAGRTRAPARKHFHLNLLTAQALVHLLHSAERRISAASVGSSRRLRHLTASVSMRARTHVCVCVYVLACLVPSQTLATWWQACPHAAHAHRLSRSSCRLDEGWPRSSCTDWKRFVACCLCVQNGSRTRCRYGPNQKKKDSMLSLLCGKKMNYGH